MGFKRFEDIEAWKKGCRLAVNIYKASQDGPLAKDFGLRDQIRRAVVSIPSNISEGYARESVTEFKRFLNIAKGSCAELRTQLYIAKALNYLDDNEADSLIKECKEISAMLSGLVNHLKANIPSLRKKIDNSSEAPVDPH